MDILVEDESMRQYEWEKKKEIKKIICNKCGKEIEKNEHGFLKEDVLSVEKRWGYFSEKDNQIHSFDICESCYDEWISSFLIPPTQ